ncbi:MAG: toxin-antitoxin system HicB family antitoxin [Planctomycetes bacterium]|nr:toxin-antitoxin system HicB family antitoxin [Planctomycetota bacterium]
MRKQLMKKFGTTKGAMPDKSGRMLVRLPKSLHKAIEVEAKGEGVSVNQLVVSKLSLPLRERITLPLHIIAQAYRSVFDGYSVDRVVVDPAINESFLAECRKLGLTDSDYAINHALLDIRKSKKLILPEATKRTEFRDYDDYKFASEIAVRLLQRTDGVTLDQVLCDRLLAAKFDRIAKEMAPKQPTLKLRWAALNLRKTRRLRPLKKSSAIEVDFLSAGPFRLVRPIELPTTPGVYSLYDQNRPLFAGETENLQHRVQLHREGTMPDWLGLTEDMGCVLRYSAMPAAKQSVRVNWLYQFIREERPLLNYQRAA